MTQRGSADPIVNSLLQERIPVTLENWLERAFPGGEPPENWWMETTLPEELEGELEAYLLDNPPLAPEPDQDLQRT